MCRLLKSHSKWFDLVEQLVCFETLSVFACEADYGRCSSFVLTLLWDLYVWLAPEKCSQMFQFIDILNKRNDAHSLTCVYDRNTCSKVLFSTVFGTTATSSIERVSTVVPLVNL